MSGSDRRLALAGIALLGVLASVALSCRWTYEADLWWHLAHGREIAAGHLPRNNLFSFTHPDYPQPSISWLFDLGVYALWQWGGAAGIQIGQALVLFLTFALLFAACRQRSGMAASLAVVVFGAFVLEPRALPRPHTISFAGMAACALLIERAEVRRSVRPLLWAVPLLVLWSNLHVESLFGLAYLGCFAVGVLLQPRQLPRALGLQALLVIAVCAVAVLINPYGLGLVHYLVENARVPEVIRIAELQPPYLPNYAPFYVYLVATLGLLVAPGAPRRLGDWLATGLFAFLALRYLRFTPLLLCSTAPMVAAALASRIGNAPALPVGALFLGLLVGRLDPGTMIQQLGIGTESLAPAEIIPRGAVGFARRVGLHGPLFNSNNIGGYLIWELYPQARVFQDSRLQAYPAQHFRDIISAYGSQPRWNELVAGVDWAVLSVPRPNELSGAGRFPSHDWATIYWDDAAEVLVRRNGVFASLIDEYEYRLLRPGFDPFAPLPTSVAAAERVLAEVQRNRADNPRSFAPAAWLCLHGDPDACGDARIAALGPGLQRAALRLERQSPASDDEREE